MTTYQGRCHCGVVRFTLRSEPITEGVRCNCSFCRRKSAVMSTRYYPPDAFETLEGREHLTLYQFGDHDVNHWFCRTCGIAPFHDATAKPGHYRINLGCLDDVDIYALPITLLDGASF